VLQDFNDLVTPQLRLLLAIRVTSDVDISPETNDCIAVYSKLDKAISVGVGAL